MTKEQIEKIAKLIFTQHKKDEKLQESAESFLNQLWADWQICTHSTAEQMNKLLEVTHAEMADWVRYFLWEVTGMGRIAGEKVIVTYDYTEYDVTSEELQIEFLVKNFATE